MQRIQLLTGNFLKIFAAVCMVFDHFGLIFFPNIMIFRIIGRISFPIFAFMISEGARYTRDKLKYFLSVAILATICQVVFTVATGVVYMSILVAFSISIPLIYLLNYSKKIVLAQENNGYKKILFPALFTLAVVFVFILTKLVEIDYGFFGIMAPVFASFFDFRGIDDLPKVLKRLDNIPFRVIAFSLSILLLAIDMLPVVGGLGAYQFFSLLSIPILLLYSGKRGKHKMKYFFYLFYPLHLVTLEAIYILIHLIK